MNRKERRAAGKRGGAIGAPSPAAALFDIGVTRLRDAPAEWSRQYAMLGLSI
jgi:hypothetical protein